MSCIFFPSGSRHSRAMLEENFYRRYYFRGSDDLVLAARLHVEQDARRSMVRPESICR